LPGRTSRLNLLFLLKNQQAPGEGTPPFAKPPATAHPWQQRGPSSDSSPVGSTPSVRPSLPGSLAPVGLAQPNLPAMAHSRPPPPFQGQGSMAVRPQGPHFAASGPATQSSAQAPQPPAHPLGSTVVLPPAPHSAPQAVQPARPSGPPAGGTPAAAPASHSVPPSASAPRPPGHPAGGLPSLAPGAHSAPGHAPLARPHGLPFGSGPIALPVPRPTQLGSAPGLPSSTQPPAGGPAAPWPSLSFDRPVQQPRPTGPPFDGPPSLPSTSYSTAAPGFAQPQGISVPPPLPPPSASLGAPVVGPGNPGAARPKPPPFGHPPSFGQPPQFGPLPGDALNPLSSNVLFMRFTVVSFFARHA
jgi:hypothetical protein